MPVDFSDLPSLLRAARMYSFRDKEETESEVDYRASLARHVTKIDPVAAMEISCGRGWDKWNADDRVAFLRRNSFLMRDTAPSDETETRKRDSDG